MSKNFYLVTYRRRDQTTCLCFWSLLGSYLKSWHQRHSLNSHLDYLEQMWLKIRSKKEVEIQSSHILYLNLTIPKMDNEIINFTTYFGLIFNVINMFSKGMFDKVYIYYILCTKPSIFADIETGQLHRKESCRKIRECP